MSDELLRARLVHALRTLVVLDGDRVLMTGPAEHIAATALAAVFPPRKQRMDCPDCGRPTLVTRWGRLRRHRASADFGSPECRASERRVVV